MLSTRNTAESRTDMSVCSWSSDSEGGIDQVNTKINTKRSIGDRNLVWEIRNLCSGIDEKGQGTILLADWPGAGGMGVGCM